MKKDLGKEGAVLIFLYDDTGTVTDYA